MRHARPIIFCCCWLPSLVAPVRAADGESAADADAAAGDEVYQVRAAAAGTHPGATVSVIHTDAHAGEAVTVADLLDREPGVRVRTLGGLGAFSSVSVRGAAPSQTLVTFDGIPLNRASTAVVDLSDFALEGLERIEIWRGLPPPDRMGAGLGGVVDLIPRRRPGAEVGVRGGSFGTRGAHGRAGERVGPVFLLGAGGYLGSRGDFTYLDTRGTSLNPADDAYVRRANNAFDQGDLYASAHGRAGGVQARLASASFLKRQGVPGRDIVQTRATSLTTAREVLDLRVGRPGRLEARSHLVFLREHYRDPDAEFGVGAQDDVGTTWAGGGELRGTLAGGAHALVIVPQVLHERWSVDRRIAQPRGAEGPVAAARTIAGGAIWDAIALAGGRLVVEPALRADVVVDDVADSGQRTFVSPRAGLRWQATRRLALHVSTGRYLRVPTFAERYGDRGFTVGSPGLRAETGEAADLGATWDGPLRLSASLLASRSRDLIVFVANSQSTQRAENVGRAHVRGAELGAEVGGRRASLAANYTFLAATNDAAAPSERGRALPGHARHAGHARATTGPWRAGPLRVETFYDADVAAGVYLDRANRLPQPVRHLHGAGVKVVPARLRRLQLTVEARNLFDVRTEQVRELPAPEPLLAPLQDYDHFPLPGRAFYASARMAF